MEQNRSFKSNCSTSFDRISMKDLTFIALALKEGKSLLKSEDTNPKTKPSKDQMKDQILRLCIRACLLKS